MLQLKDLYESSNWNIMCTGENNDKNKTNLPPSPFTPVTVFLKAEKLLSL